MEAGNGHARATRLIVASPQHVTQQFLHFWEFLESLEIYVVSRADKGGEKFDKHDFEGASTLIARRHGGRSIVTTESHYARRPLFPMTKAHKGDGPPLEVRLDSCQ